MRSHSSETASQPLMSNSPTLGNVHSHTHDDVSGNSQSFNEVAEESPLEEEEEPQNPAPEEIPQPPDSTYVDEDAKGGLDKDGFFSVRLTPLIDHSSTSSGLYFSPIIRRLSPKTSINIGRYTEKEQSGSTRTPGIFSTDCFQK